MKNTQAFWWGFALPLIVFFDSCWFSSWVLHDMYKSAIGAHIGQLNEMKKECEKSLPRDKVCKAEIKFVVEENK